MKKFLAMFLALLMVFSLAACGGDDAETTTPPASQPGGTNTDAPKDTDPPAPAQGEEISFDPLIHLDFETADGLKAVRQGAVGEDPNLEPNAKALLDSVHEILITDGYGAVGNSLMLDGKYGVKVENMPTTSDDTYTIAFWYAADRYSQFGPLLQIGRNVGMAEGVTWINFTKADTWGIAGVECAPVAWNRNSDEDVWPWMGNNIDLLGKREWVHLALVVDGTTYKDDAGKPHVGAQFYVNGALVMEASAADIGLVDDAGLAINNDWKGMSPDILTTEGTYGLECLLGVNYWDQYSKEYIDEFYLYDEALTAGQVATLYNLGNPPAYETMPNYDGPLDDGSDAPEPAGPEPQPAAPVDSNAIDTLGTPDRVLGFWSDTTDGFEVADGAGVTLKLNNYSDGVNNWDNFVLAFTNTAVTTDKLASADNYAGYAEYAVLRADAFGWGDASYAATFETSWGDDWAGWLKLMTEAKVEVDIMRKGGELTINYSFTGADGYIMAERAIVTSTLAAGDPCYVHVTGEGAYIELLDAYVTHDEA